MNDNQIRHMSRGHLPLASLAVAALAATVFAVPLATAADPGAPGPKPVAAKAQVSKPKSFATPDAAFQALVDAAKSSDDRAIAALLGPSGASLVHSGDAVADKQREANFVSAYDAKHAVKMDGDAKATLIIGSEDWPMPIPAIKNSRGWTLDASAGAVEILARRIGRNELETIEVVRAIVDAEHEYASEDRHADGLRAYAATLISTAGKKDGLYWPTKEGEPQSPLGPLVAWAMAEGYSGKHGNPTPYRGYYFRLLTAQGKDAPGGARSYLAHGRLIGGFAVVAYPALYGNSGIMTFIANQDGVVHQKDLGPTTAALVRNLRAYNPDKTWTIVP